MGLLLESELTRLTGGPIVYVCGPDQKGGLSLYLILFGYSPLEL